MSESPAPLAGLKPGDLILVTAEFFMGFTTIPMVINRPHHALGGLSLPADWKIHQVAKIGRLDYADLPHYSTDDHLLEMISRETIGHLLSGAEAEVTYDRKAVTCVAESIAG